MPSQKQIESLVLQNDIEELIARFDDAVLVNDGEAFRSLWTEDCVWEIAAPVPMIAKGLDQVVAALDKFHSTNEFFFRSTARPVIQAEGERATFRSPTMELARREGRVGYANVAMYLDEARMECGRWLFVRRYYQYFWVDLTTPLNGEAVLQK